MVHHDLVVFKGEPLNIYDKLPALKSKDVLGRLPAQAEGRSLGRVPYRLAKVRFQHSLLAS